MDDQILEQVLRNQLAMMNTLVVLIGSASDLRQAIEATNRLLERIRQDRVHAHK